MEKINAFIERAKNNGWFLSSESEEGVSVTLSVPEDDSLEIDWEDFEVIPTNIRLEVLEERAFGEHIGSLATIEFTFHHVKCWKRIPDVLGTGHEEEQYLVSLENHSPLVWP